jgi:TonB-dependent starch-binding outer membrane protein SusC
MRALHRTLGSSSLVALACTLAACAGAPVNTALRPVPAALRSASALRGGSEPGAAITSSATRGEIAPSQARLYSNLEEMLNGRVAGLQVLRRYDGTYSLRVRNAHSLYGDTEPLLIIDGLTYGSAGAADLLTTMSPQDIQRIDVLKDAGATAFYGSRGSNGVVLITTRRRGS